MKKQKLIAMSVSFMMLVISLPVLSYAEEEPYSASPATAASAVSEAETEKEEITEESRDIGNAVDDEAEVNPEIISSNKTSNQSGISLASLSGSGTANDPYKIYDQYDLLAVESALDAYYSLQNDITVTYGTWTPIGSSTAFSGCFNGNGYKISGIVCDGSGYEYSGLFARNSGVIENVNVNIMISATGQIGGLAAYNNGTITNCVSSGSVTNTSGGNTGGLIGTNEGTVTTSGSTAVVSGNSNVGGLIGNNARTATVTNSYAQGNVTGKSNVGGLVGVNSDASLLYVTVIRNCYASGIVNNGEGAGLVGTNFRKGRVYNSYYRSTNTGNQTGFSVPTIDLKQQSTYYFWDFDNIWEINGDYPYINIRGEEAEIEFGGYGDKDEPYCIENEKQLYALSVDLAKIGEKNYYQLANDINITAKYWMPIGVHVPYVGIFDGNGHSITGAAISGTYYSDVGLFGKNNGTIENLKVSGSISGNNNVGVLAGYSNGTITNCISSGSAANISGGNTGGLIGTNEGTVTTSGSTAVVSGNSNVGGLIGNNARTATVTNSYAQGNVTGKSNVGGLVGVNSDASLLYVSVIKNCYAIGAVSKGSSTGGLIGHNYGTVTSGYYNKDTALQSDTDKGTPVSTTNMKNVSTYAGWDFDAIWAIDSSINNGYPYLRSMIPKETVAVRGVRLDKTDLTLDVGQTYELTAIIEPENADNPAIRWTSSNTNAATVSNGKVIAKNSGVSTITATTIDGGYTAECNITVKVGTPTPVPTDVPPTPTATAVPVTPPPAPVVTPTLIPTFAPTAKPTEAPFTLIGIRIKSQPSKTTAVEGTALDTSGLKVEAVYSDGKTEEITDYTLSGYEPNRLGKQTINVEYSGFKASFEITVEAKKLIGISVTQKPDKRSYVQGEQFDTTGMIVTAMYNNGTNEEITGYNVLGYDPNYIGSQTVSVSYNGFSAAFTVTVSPKEQLAGTAETPKISISSFIGGKTVTLTTATEGAQIYYTLDGTAPSTGSNLYSGPITLTETASVKAIAVKDGMDQSKTAGGKITVGNTETPISSHSAGQVEVGTVITLRSETSGSMIYYTTDGSKPTTESRRYSGGIGITSDVTIKAIAVKDGYKNSGIFESVYTVPKIEPGSAAISLGSVSGAAGDTISVPVYLFMEDESGITDYRFTLNYDASKFEYQSVTPAEGSSAADLFTSASGGAVTVLYSGAAIESGEVCNVNLKALESDEDGEYPISIQKDSVKIETETENKFNIDITDGAITLIGSTNSNLELKSDVMLTDANGNDITDRSGIKGDVTANVTLENTSGDAAIGPVTVNIIMAVYDRNGCLVSMLVTDADLSDLNYVFTSSIDIPEGVEVGNIKLMVWNGLSDMTPMSAASTIL